MYPTAPFDAAPTEPWPLAELLQRLREVAGSEPANADLQRLERACDELKAALEPVVEAAR